MTKFRLIAAAAMAGAITMLSSGTAHADNYPEPPIVITIDDADLIGGKTFSYEVTSGSVNCDWTITYADGHAPGVSATQTGSGTSISGSYKTKVVKSVFRSPITAKCVYNDGRPEPTSSSDDATTGTAFFSTASGAATVQAISRTASASATVTLRPVGSDSGDGSALPDTGGSNLSLFLLAGGLVLVGGGVTYMARRRQSSH